jgi:hypothetical protein
MPRMEFEPTIPAFERAKMICTLDPAVTVIGISTIGITNIISVIMLDNGISAVFNI